MRRQFDKKKSYSNLYYGLIDKQIYLMLYWWTLSISEINNAADDQSQYK